MATRPSSDLAAFRDRLQQSRRLVILTGAGVSAESGVPTFRGAGGFWRKLDSTLLATPQAFAANPSLVWEFYHYRRELMGSKEPNKAHMAIADIEKRWEDEGKRVVVITQNIDELHRRAGTKNLLELHGSLFKTRCTTCEKVEDNHVNPICEALRGKGSLHAEVEDAHIPEKDLPRCQEPSCGGLLRPHVVWFGEDLDSIVMAAAEDELAKCDMCLVVGTSSVVHPAAMFAPKVASRGVPVAEFNLEDTPVTNKFGFQFYGRCGETLPKALKP